LDELGTLGADVPRLLTAAFGISAEAGEFTEIVKKMFLQGKPYNEDNIIHMKKEAGDILWYMSQVCIALDTTFEELMEINYQKLSARYPEGTFDVYRSENRKEGDL
jgi:NTP pyrophosphatase (non-canonical NTP hydrolase)